MPELKPYNPRAVCPKCSHRVITTRYHAKPEPLQICATEGVEGEHMHRKCQRCGFEWLQKPKEQT